MKYGLCFVAGFMACFLIGTGPGVYLKLQHPWGSMTYRGDGAVSASDGNNKYEITQKGQELPYGMYKIKLKNGRTLSILKNNRGNVEIQEDGDTVLVYGDENTIWATLEKK